MEPYGSWVKEGQRKKKKRHLGPKEIGTQLLCFLKHLIVLRFDNQTLIAIHFSQQLGPTLNISNVRNSVEPKFEPRKLKISHLLK